MNQSQKLYTCVSKPGEYEFVGTSSGAGTLKGLPVIVYRDVTSGRLFHREPENFMARMKLVQPEQADINAELLAALEKLSARGFFEESSCADADTNADMAEMRAAIAKAKGGTK